MINVLTNSKTQNSDNHCMQLYIPSSKEQHTWGPQKINCQKHMGWLVVVHIGKLLQ